MKLNELCNQLGYKLLTTSLGDNDITDAYTSDLLSDVMGNAKDLENFIIITIQAHKNTVAVSSMLDAKAILICNNREIPDDMIQAAEQEGIGVISCSDNQFKASAKVYNLIF